MATITPRLGRNGMPHYQVRIRLRGAPPQSRLRVRSVPWAALLLRLLPALPAAR